MYVYRRYVVYIISNSLNELFYPYCLLNKDKIIYCITFPANTMLHVTYMLVVISYSTM